MIETRIKISVACYAGYRGEETPRTFSIKSREIKVTKIIDRWLAPDHRYFKVLGDDGATYILRHAPATDQWDLTLYHRGPQKTA